MLLALQLAVAGVISTGLLHPQDSETRETKDLGGLWRFKPDYRGAGVAERWYSSGLPDPTQLMPVPCSFNDVTQDRALRDLVGVVCTNARSSFRCAG